ncbi:MAG TPA: hypothetical protein PKD78_00600 [Saprospiraceae bacterium]|nr:hypothetical protein [Saprospiraceae bacterium]
MKKLLLGFYALIALSLGACKDGTDDPIVGTGDVEIEFENRAGDATMILGNEYTNAAGEKLRFSTFNYYISNIVLVNKDGSTYTVPKNDSYFLVKQADAPSRTIQLSNVPAGDYTGLRFVLGVDSLKSVSPAAERTGVLDPATGASGHYWAWNSGYIFLKMEGTSPAAPVDPGSGQQRFEYHIGLYGGLNSKTINNLKNISLTVPDEAAKVRQGEEAPHFHLYADALEMFDNPTVLKIAEHPAVHAEAFSATLANNYADMFSIDHVHNH